MDLGWWFCPFGMVQVTLCRLVLCLGLRAPWTFGQFVYYYDWLSVGPCQKKTKNGDVVISFIGSRKSHLRES